ncbi:MAG TPA: alpha/beta hydrolase, partial [Cytophagales bacterium]|nr:alpha/beta hydrolase [Cytophagales bacterium]
RLAAESTLTIESLITIGAPWCNADIAASQNLLQELDLQGWKQMMPEAYASFERYHEAQDPAEFLDKVKTMWSDESSAGYPNDRVRLINCPTLIIRGDADDLFPRQSAAKLADSIRHSKLLNLPFAGHAVFDEQRDIIISVLKQFSSQIRLKK